MPQAFHARIISRHKDLPHNLITRKTSHNALIQQSFDPLPFHPTIISSLNLFITQSYQPQDNQAFVISRHNHLTSPSLSPKIKSPHVKHMADGHQ